MDSIDFVISKPKHQYGMMYDAIISIFFFNFSHSFEIRSNTAQND